MFSEETGSAAGETTVSWVAEGKGLPKDENFWWQGNRQEKDGLAPEESKDHRMVKAYLDSRSKRSPRV